MRIQRLPDTQKSVYNNILYPGYKMLFNIYVLLLKSFIQILLKLCITQSVALFMFWVLFWFVLEALVGEMHLVIFGWGWVLVRWGAQVTVLVQVDFEVVGQDCPDSDVELPRFVEERLFDVLLEDPTCVAHRHWKQKLLDVPQISKNLNTTPLISVLRFHQPNIFLTVLCWCLFSPAVALGNFLKPVSKRREWVFIFVCQRDQKSCRGGLKHWVASCLGFFIVLIIAFQWFYQTTFGANASKNFKMVEN